MLVSPQIFGSGGGGGSNFTFSTDGKFQYPENVVIPNTVTSLQTNNSFGFYGHTEPMNISFEAGSTITTIPNYAFQCGVVELILPPSLTYVQGFSIQSGSLKKIVFNSICQIEHQSGSVANPFSYCTALEDIQVPVGWTTSLYINGGADWAYTSHLTHDSMVALFTNLYDFTGDTDSHFIALGATNLARLSEAEKAIATDKNWTLS